MLLRTRPLDACIHDLEGSLANRSAGSSRTKTTASSSPNRANAISRPPDIHGSPVYSGSFPSGPPVEHGAFTPRPPPRPIPTCRSRLTSFRTGEGVSGRKWFRTRNHLAIRATPPVPSRAVAAPAGCALPARQFHEAGAYLLVAAGRREPNGDGRTRTMHVVRPPPW